MGDCILVVDDDVVLTSLLVASLKPKGFEVLSATDAWQGLKLAYDRHPDLVILDVMMPGFDGWQTCARLREMSDVPIIMLTAKTEEQDVVRGLQLGADDYIKKPFALTELEERIRAILRRTKTYKPQKQLAYDDGILSIDFNLQQVFRRNKLLHLTPTEFRLLRCLVQQAGSVITHQELLTEVWGPSYADATASLSLYIRYLREKIEDDPKAPRYIQTKWGVGYLFAPSGATVTS